MKIQEIVNTTGLTDRAIRFYIEEGLISPEYTENFLGRKNFCFTEADVERLRDIATLRAFDFTVQQIKDLMNCPESSCEILEFTKMRAEEELLKSSALLHKITPLCDGNPHTFAEIAYTLRSLDAPIPEERIATKKLFGMMLSGFKYLLIFATAILPIALSVILCTISFVFLGYKYPKLNTLACAALFICLVIYAGVLILSKTKRKACAIIRNLLIIVCVLTIPINVLASLSIPSHSETCNVENYAGFDSDVMQSISPWYVSLFPEKDFVKSLGDESVNYHYRFVGSGVSCAYDIFLECKFPSEDAYKAELERLKSLFDEASKSAGKTGEIRKYGSYSAYFFPVGTSLPFEERWQEFYTYIIFAFDNNTNTVRYIYNTSMEFSGFGSLPYYRELNWS